MKDDLDYLRSRVPGYEPYTTEQTRAETDMRVRAFVGERLADVQVKYSDNVDAPTNRDLEQLLLQCEFTDQRFIKRIEHAVLEPQVIDALLAVDRSIVELAERLPDATPEELDPLLNGLAAQFEARSAPLPTSSPAR